MLELSLWTFQSAYRPWFWELSNQAILSVMSGKRCTNQIAPLLFPALWNSVYRAWKGEVLNFLFFICWEIGERPCISPSASPSEFSGTDHMSLLKFVSFLNILMLNFSKTKHLWQSIHHKFLPFALFWTYLFFSEQSNRQREEGKTSLVDSLVCSWMIHHS